MDSPAPVAPWVVLGVALVALVAVVAGLALSRRRAPARPRQEERPPPPERPPGPHWAVDDLPAFLEAPPGTPVPETRPAAAPAPAAPPGPDPSARTVAALAAAGLALVAVLAGVALGSDRGEPVAAGAPRPAVPGPSTPPASPTPARPELPPVPADPLPGERGAGLLAARSVPLGDAGVAARLALGGLVLERRAVGVTVGYPSVSVSVGTDGTALAHVLLPAWNCLGTTAPADPEAAGCTPVPTEYADLPTPALTVTRDGDALRLAGRFPTYTRPTATPPAYTGRVYDLSVTVAPAGGLDGGEAPADGTLFLGTERAEALPDPSLSRIRVAG